MPHLDVNSISYALPDGRPLLDRVSFRVGDGARVALIGPNGTGKTTLVKIITGELSAHDGAVTTSGSLAVMNQFIGKIRDDTSVRELLTIVAPDRVRLVAEALEAAEVRMMEVDDESAPMAYVQVLADFGDAGGYGCTRRTSRCGMRRGCPASANNERACEVSRSLAEI